MNNQKTEKHKIMEDMEKLLPQIVIQKLYN